MPHGAAVCAGVRAAKCKGAFRGFVCRAMLRAGRLAPALLAACASRDVDIHASRVGVPLPGRQRCVGCLPRFCCPLGTGEACFVRGGGHSVRTETGGVTKQSGAIACACESVQAARHAASAAPLGARSAEQCKGRLLSPSRCSGHVLLRSVESDSHRRAWAQPHSSCPSAPSIVCS